VINKQRETIYAERDKVLRNEDLTDTITAFLDEDLGEVVGRHLGAPGDTPTHEGLTELLVELGRMGIGPEHVKLDELVSLPSAAAVLDHLREVTDDMLDARETEVGPEAWAAIERYVLLRSIDGLWVEHLTELDDMRRGIGLRGYSQQDPLNEFRKEAFGLYEELSGFIRHQVASTIFRVTVQQQPQAVGQGAFAMPGPGQAARGGQLVGAGSARGGRVATAGRGGNGMAAAAAPRLLSGAGITGTTGTAAAAGAGAAGAQARPGYTPTGDKIGRNDACWCGSGLKYKKCHGR
jgi:preprotein translocase subunit SecA